MLKCPNCGSTAQVKLNGYDQRSCDTIRANYSCGCGAKFHVSYRASNAIYIDYLPDNTYLSPLGVRMINAINKKRNE